MIVARQHTSDAVFIGLAAFRHAIDSTIDSMVNFDTLTYDGNLESLHCVRNSEYYAFGQVDICDTSKLMRVFRKPQPDVVMPWLPSLILIV